MQSSVDLFIEHSFFVNYIEKTQRKNKWPGMAHLKNDTKKPLFFLVMVRSDYAENLLRLDFPLNLNNKNRPFVEACN